jgi:hypothetical protein
MGKKIVNETPFLILDGRTSVRDALPILFKRLGIQNVTPDVFKGPEYLNPAIAESSAFNDFLATLKYNEGSFILKNNKCVDIYWCVTEICLQTECKELTYALDYRKDDFTYANNFINEGYNRAISSTNFKTILYLDAVDGATYGNYNAMLLLGSLALESDTGILDLGKETGQHATYLDALTSYGYDKEKLGSNEYRIRIANQYGLRLCAKDIPSAVRILGTHMNIKDLYFGAVDLNSLSYDTEPLQENKNVGIQICANKKELDRINNKYLRTPKIVLEGKVASYLAEPKEVHKTGLKRGMAS